MKTSAFPGKFLMATVSAPGRYSPGVRKARITAIGAWLALLLFYIIAFPKGGVKAAGVPLTIGYALTLFLMATALLRSRGLAIPFDRILAFSPCLLLAFWSALVIYQNGAESVGFTISYFISILYLPLFGLVVFSSSILDDHIIVAERAFVWAVRFIVVYGIFLFAFKQATGSWIEVPYITVNAADIGQLDDKYINRGGIFKLISTYNNGNIFGVCMAIMTPLYLRLEPRKSMTWLAYLAMFLTLSRTVWIGAILIVLLSNLAKGIRPISLLYLALGLLAVGGAIFALLNLLGRDMSFVFDSQLGGRASQLEVLYDVRFIPEERFIGLSEIVYLGVLGSFGVPGLLLFVAHLVMPTLLLHLEGVRLLSLTRAGACLQGLAIYIVIACSDAAFSYIPVMMIFWMVAGMGFWYAHRQGKAMKDIREASR